MGTFTFPKNAQDHIEKGNNLYKNGRYAKALCEYNIAINMDPGNILAWENLGWAYWKSGNVSSAFKIWDNLLNLHPDDINVVNRVASIYGNVYCYDKSIKLYEKSLSFKPGQKEVLIDMAKVFKRMGNYSDAYEKITIVRKDYPNEEEILCLLAAILEMTAQYGNAIEIWKQLGNINPTSLEYKFNIAINQFRAGHYKEAVILANEILQEKPDYTEAIRLLAEEAVVRNDLFQAQQIFSGILKYNPKDLKALNRISDIALLNKDYDAVIQSASKSLEVDPLQYYEYNKRADAYLEKKQYGKSIKDYNFMLSKNPNNEIAIVGLIWAYSNQNSYNKAFKLLESIQSNLPKGDVQIDILKALLKMHSENYLEAIEILTHIRETLNNGVITSLLYHDISANPNDPENTYVGDFREHIRMLKEEGYNSITIGEIIKHYQEGIPLPPKPLLITFDDAKRNSYTYADPILEEFGFKATMFIPIGLMRRNPYTFLSFEELKKMFDSGIWDIQSHGLYAHDHVIIDASGKKGDFLTNKKWLENKGVVESDNAFYERIREDFKQSKETIEKEIPGAQVVAYAFPRGKINFTNYPSAMETILALFKEFYKFGLYQNNYGQYILNKDHMFIQRLLVKPGTKMEELQEYLHNYSLWYCTLLLLGELYIWEDDFSKANEFLQEIPNKEHDKNYHTLMGLLKREEGHPKEAEREFQAVLKLDKDNVRASKYLKDLDTRLSPRFIPQFTYFKDKSKREKHKYSAHLYKYLTEDINLHLAYERAFFHDRYLGKVNENQLFTELLYYPSSEKQGISVYGKARLFSNDKEFLAYKVMGETPLTNQISTSLSFERDVVDTAGGILEDISYYRSKAYINIEPIKSIFTSLRYEHDWYSDDNNKDFARLRIMKKFNIKFPEISLGYGYRWADSKFDALEYYTPIDSSIHEVHFIGILSKGRLLLNQYCIFGYGEESNTEGFTSYLDTTFRYTLKKGLDIFAQATFHRTPVYNSETVTIGIEYRF